MQDTLEVKKEKIIETLRDKKAKDIKILNIGELSTLADFFIIATGTSTTHVQALADNLEEKMEEAGYPIHHKEGFRAGRWILLDYYDIVVHLFFEEERGFYNLEKLWADANAITVED